MTFVPTVGSLSTTTHLPIGPSRTIQNCANAGVAIAAKAMAAASILSFMFVHPNRMLNRISWLTSQYAAGSGGLDLSNGARHVRFDAGTRAGTFAEVGGFGDAMPIYRLLQNTSYDRELIEMLTSVFEDISRELGLAAIEDALRDTLARAIIQCAEQGIRDPLEIRRCAYGVLKPA